MFAVPTQLEILDLRHFSAAQLKPLLRDEAERWQRRLHWDYTRASAMLLDYLDGRILPGYVSLRSGKVTGYAFSVFEAAKAVIGDVYAFDETASIHNSTCDTLLHHLIETLQSTPGIDRIESQLLMFPFGALHGPFLGAGFRSYSRLFMMCDLDTSVVHHHLDRPTGAERPMYLGLPQESNHTLHSWLPGYYEPAAALIHLCYDGHMDAQINDQYQTLSGSQRFLHNIIRFPGCGTFDAENSWALRNAETGAIDGLLLCSRVRSDVGHITQLCIHPALRGKGLGQTLLKHCAGQLRQRGVKALSLTVTEANIGALRLYEHNGFVPLHRFEAMVWDKS